MKAIKINVEKKKLEYVELDLTNNDNAEIYKHIGNGCSHFECPKGFQNDDIIYTDEEICLRENDIKGGFMMENWKYPLLNNGIILGTNLKGESIDCASKIEDLENKIFFVSIELAKIWARTVINTPPKMFFYEN
jgi:hypothetical protein